MALPQCPQKTLTNQLEFLSKNVLPFLMRHPIAKPFLKPVDYVSFGLPDYPTIIKYSIDLTTIKDRLSRRFYARSKDCLRDLYLMFQNCYIYNSPGEIIIKKGLQLEKELQSKLKLMPINEFKINKVAKHHIMPLTNKPYVPRKFSKVAVEPEKSEPSKEILNPKMPQIDYDKCQSLLGELMSHKYKNTNYLFLKPVDAKSLGLLDYYDVIKCPMDLGTIKHNLDNGNYQSRTTFINDIYLMINNCLIYNGVDSDIGIICKNFQSDFENLSSVVFKERCLDNEHDDAFYFLIRVMRRHKEIEQLIRGNADKIANSRHRIDMIVNILEESNIVDKKRRKKEVVD